MNVVKKVDIDKILKVLFAFSCILFVLPSVIYLIKNKTVFGFDKWFCFLLNDSNRNMQTLLYLVILAIMTILYCLIIKRQKEIFRNIRQVLTYTLIISAIFLISISFTCSDVFYYLGIGRLDSIYNQNPYYITITDFVESQDKIEGFHKDTVLIQGYQNDWADTTVVYGPIWTAVCKFVAALSLGNVDLGIFIFRTVNILIHILNCYLIYKISNKKIFSVIYGLNPFMLIEGIMSIHNDIFVVCFILFALYFLTKQKKLKTSLIFLVMSAAVKYFAILLLPLFIIYHFREEKVLKRFGRCIQYGLFFALILIIPYLFYIRDLDVFAGILTMQTRFAKNFYIVIEEFFGPSNLKALINKFLLVIFIYTYALRCLVLLFKQKIKFNKEAKEVQYFLIAFLFLLITNFQPWYIMWLFPLLMWQSSKNMKLIIQISLISQFANSIFLAYTENWKNGTPFTFCMLLGVVICIGLNNIKKKRKKI